MFKPLDIQVDTVNFTLTNYGGFGEGDTVYVEGYFVGPDTVCVESVGLIDNYLIQPCDTLPGIFYEGCGILVESLDCLLFQPFPNTIGGLNVLLVLDNFGTFGIGDTVYVTGDIEWNCHDSCWGADGCIYGNTIADCENEPEPPIIAVCGLLLDLQGCLTFEPFTYCDSLFLLTNYGNFGACDTVFVEGTIEPWIDTCGPATALIDNSLIWLCRPDCTLVIPIVDVQNVRHYPNPFNPSATIYFELTAPMKVSLTIYNILGQKVETLIDNQLLSGPQQVMWDGSRYASGIYLYQIRTEKEVITRKMSLSK